jgi:hemoglobin/transferrin/lactoferrin receptor protein
MRSSRVVWVLVFVLAARAASAAGIAGTAADPSGAPLAGARVIVTNVATGAQLPAQADQAGRFVVDGLPIGIYRVAIETGGFSADARTISIVDPDETIEVTFILHPGGLTSDVTVTAARNERDPLEVPLRTDSIGRQEIQDLQPMSTGDALVVAPGVTPVGSGPFGVRPRLRGLDSTRLLILVDGERLNNARTATDRAGTEVGLIDINTVQAMEVVSGAGSVLYGTDALAGTINIITGQPTFSDRLAFKYGFDGLYSSNENGRRGTASFGVSAPRFAVGITGSLEDFDDYRAGGDGREDTRPFFASGQIRQADTIDDAFGFGFRAFPDPFNDPFVRASADIPRSGATGNTLSANGIVALTGNQTLRVKYLRRRVEDIGFPDFEPPYFFQVVTLPYSNLDRVSARYEARALTPWFSNFKVSAYYHDQDRLLRNEFPVQFPAPTPQRFFPIGVFRLNILSDSRQHVRTPGIDVQATFVPHRSHVLTAGTTIYRDDSRDTRLTSTQTTMIGSVVLGARGPQANVFDPPVVLGPPAVANPVRVPDSTFRDIGAFVQDEWDLTRAVRVVAGLRLDGYRVTTESTPGYDVASIVAGAVPPIRPEALPETGGDEVSRTAVTGDLGVVFRPAGAWSLFAHYGRSYRHPNLEEMLFAGPATIGAIAPNLRVEPETGHNVDLGVKVHTGRYAGSLTYFNNRYDGFISTEFVALVGTDPLSQAINFADVRIQGVEGDLEVPWSFRLGTMTGFAGAAYTYGEVLSGTNLLTGTSLAGTPQDNITPFKGTFGGRFTDARDRFWVEYGARVQTRVTRVAPTLLESPFLIAQDLLSLDGFTVQRLAWGINLRREEGRLGLTFAIENLGDAFYREHFQFAPARGRSFTIGVHVDGR